MSETDPSVPAGSGPVPGVRLVWNFHPVIPALAFLGTAALAAVALYGHPSGQVAALTGAGALALLVVAIATMRMVFAVDHDGLTVRFLGAPQWIGWQDVDSVVLTTVRGSETIAVVGRNEQQIDVPPSLLQPVRPMTKASAHVRLQGFLGQVCALRPTDS